MVVGVKNYAPGSRAESEKSELQRLKPHKLRRADVVAKATTHKNSPLLTRPLKAKLN
jgi:hypothetical protein